MKRIVVLLWACFVLLFSRYGFLRNYILFPILHLCKDKRIAAFKNAHKGKKCFIIGTGPSLRISDLESLSDGFLTIGLNSIYKLYDNTSFRPDYYLALDPDVSDKTFNQKDIDSFGKNNLFFNSIVRKKRKSKKIIWLHYNYQNHWFNVFNPKYDHSKNLRYKDELSKGIFDKYTVTVAAIELAIYMGCEEIYLLGVDCNYTGPVQHAGGDDSNKITYDQAFFTQKAMMCGFGFIHKIAIKKGIQIFNATRGGMLEEFPRVDFDNLMKLEEKI